MDVTGPDVQLKLSTVLGENLVTCRKVNDLVVRGVNEHQEVLLPRTYSREEIPAKRGQIPRPESVLGWPHLERLSRQLMPNRQDVEVGLLVGANCTRAIKPREVIPGADDDPYAMKTTLGWGVIGNASPKENGEQNEHCSCNRIVSREIGAESSRTVGHFVLKTHVKEVISSAQVGKMFEFDFNEAVGEDKAHSYLQWRSKILGTFLKKALNSARDP